MHWQKVTVIGVGLLGGSLGLALKQRRLAKTVVGNPRNDTVRMGALVNRAQLASVREGLAHLQTQAELLHDGSTRNELTYYLPAGWDAVVERDIDGERAETTLVVAGSMSRDRGSLGRDSNPRY